MKKDQLRQWQDKQKLTNDSAANLLGVSGRLFRHYLNGERDGKPKKIPVYIVRSCLWIENHGSEVQINMTIGELIQWQDKQKLTNDAAAKLLGIGNRLYSYYLNGERDGKPKKIPRYIMLSCWWIDRYGPCALYHDDDL